MPASKVNRFRRRLESLLPLSMADGDLLDRVLADPDLVPARADLVSRHDRKGGRLILVDGFAYQYRMLTSGRRQITAYLVPGDSYDLDAARENGSDHAVMALTSVRSVHLTTAEVAVLSLDHPSIAEGLRLVGRIEEATLREWLVNIGGRPALERIAHLFCELDRRLHAVGLVDQDRFEMPITQYDLADTAGLSSVHVNRTIQELRRQGLIALTGRSLTILDRPSLQALADFQPRYLRLRASA
ncbi:Crp/Fnr family transcriptional regulator [Methylobacterium adhaesivum]|uniref:Crp/Fnr family transcriptional regulator n=1 Tax=Methylobacterium adhaesivum TaxID=333297 RepID=A0ABT8BEV5_9HYPH|nr:Crp/Fnr family transcriptional regulator [Methylobacterium adhaesivum]